MPYGNLVAKKVHDDMLEDQAKRLNTLPLPLGAFVLSSSEKFMNNFIHIIDGFKSNDLYYEDIDCMYIENKHWDKLNRASLVEKNFCKQKKTIKKIVLFSLDCF